MSTIPHTNADGLVIEKVADKMIGEVRLGDIMAIQDLRFTVPKGGGIIRLVGPNGAGKTCALNAIDYAMTGRGKVESRDGAPRGYIEAFGAKITVGKSRNQKTGELEVISLEGKLDISTLVDPGIKDADSADSKRIKALVQLTSQKPDPTLFYELLGGQEQYDLLVGSSVESSTGEDLVTLSARVKRKLEEVARTHEDAAKTADANAAAARRADPDLDLTAEHDETVLGKALEDAIRAESKLIADDDEYKRAVEASRKAELGIEDAEASYDGPTVERCTEIQRGCQDEVDVQQAKVSELQDALRVAQQCAENARNQLARAIQLRKAAEQHEQTIARWRSQLAKPEQKVTAEQLEASAQAVLTARKAVEQGAIIRHALAAKQQARKFQEAADNHRREATRLRDAAKATDNVLSDIVGRLGCPLRVEGGRLVTDHPKRGKGVPYSELSMGERYAIAVPIAIHAVGHGGVFTLRQEAFEGLDFANRKMIAELLHGTGVTMITAECSKDADDNGLRSEVYEPNGQAVTA